MFTIKSILISFHFFLMILSEILPRKGFYLDYILLNGSDLPPLDMMLDCVQTETCVQWRCMSINLHVMKGILANFARSGILAPETIISHDTSREQAHWGPGHWGNAKYWEPLAPDPFFWYNCTTYESDRSGASVTNTCGRADIEVTDPQLCERQEDTAASI